jgi:hypothetical protein
VFTETDNWPAISGLDRFVGRYRSTRNSPGLSASAGGRRMPSGPDGCALHHVEDVGQQRGVGGLVPRQRLQQFS